MHISELKIGQEVIAPNLFHVTQEVIDNFADVTGDHQWIHVEPERCAQQSPFKKTIAHGFLTASLISQQFASTIMIDDSKQTLINYGMDGLRFLDVIQSDSYISYSFTLMAKENKASGVLHRFKVAVNIKNHDRLALVGEMLILLIE